MYEENKLEILKRVVRDNLEVRTSLIVTNDYPRLKKTLQHLMEVKFKDESLRPLFDLLLRYSLQAEEHCPGSGVVLLERFSRVDKEYMNLDKRRMYRKDVEAALLRLSYSKRITKILLSLLENSSQDTKITVKKSSNSKTYLEVTEGHSFNLKKLLKGSPVILTDTRISCIDGYIESASEVHKLLTELSETKESCILFCRGMSEDVLHTIKVNNDRKTLNLHPYVAPYDIDNVNTLVDIAVTSNTDVVSTTKGDLISSVGLQSLGKVVTSILSSDNVILTPMKSTKNSLERHISSLRKTIVERPELEETLSDRLKSLSSHNLYVCLPDDINYYSDRQQIDEGIRVIMSIIKNSYGPVDTAEHFFKSLETRLSDLVF